MTHPTSTSASSSTKSGVNSVDMNAPIPQPPALPGEPVLSEVHGSGTGVETSPLELVITRAPREARNPSQDAPLVLPLPKPPCNSLDSTVNQSLLDKVPASDSVPLPPHSPELLGVDPDTPVQPSSDLKELPDSRESIVLEDSSVSPKDDMVVSRLQTQPPTMTPSVKESCEALLSMGCDFVFDPSVGQFITRDSLPPQRGKDPTAENVEVLVPKRKRRHGATRYVPLSCSRSRAQVNGQFFVSERNSVALFTDSSEFAEAQDSPSWSEMEARSLDAQRGDRSYGTPPAIPSEKSARSKNTQAEDRSRLSSVLEAPHRLTGAFVGLHSDPGATMSQRLIEPTRLPSGPPTGSQNGLLFSAYSTALTRASASGGGDCLNPAVAPKPSSLDPCLSPMIAVIDRLAQQYGLAHRTTIEADAETSLLPSCASASPPDDTRPQLPPSSSARDAEALSLASVRRPGEEILCVTIHSASLLHRDSNVVHPFVRVWALNGVTGENLLLRDANVFCGITHPYDLRLRRSRAPRWDAEILLHVDASALHRAGTGAVLLFEVLDCGNEALDGGYVPRTGCYPICWAYRMLCVCSVGCRETRVWCSDLQMFPFPTRVSCLTRLLQFFFTHCWAAAAVLALLAHYPYPAHQPSPQDCSPVRPVFVEAGGGHESVVIDSAGKHFSSSAQDDRMRSSAKMPAVWGDVPPAIFYVFRSRLNRKIPYAGGLKVSFVLSQQVLASPRLCIVPLPSEKQLLEFLVRGGGQARPRYESEDVGPILVDQHVSCDVRFLCLDAPGRAFVPWSKLEMGAQRGGSADPMARVSAAALYHRRPNERVLLPSVTLETALVPGKITCMTFTRGDVVLAVGVTRASKYVVELRNALRSGVPVVAQGVGHTGPIHTVAFDPSDRFLLSCAADKTARVWAVAELVAFCSSPDISPHGCHIKCCVLLHSIPVHSAIFHADCILTAGSGSVLFLWRYDALRRTELTLDEGVYRASSQTALLPNGSIGPTSAVTFHSGFVPGSAMRPGSPFAPSTFRVDGQLAGETRLEEGAHVLGLASDSTSEHAWSISSRGVVRRWDVGGETDRPWDPRSHRQLRLLCQAVCPGASKIQVKGSYALLSCPDTLLVYILDATTAQLVRAVNAQRATSAPLYLLPDGNAFVAPALGHSLFAWDCVDGSLCTSLTGCDHVKGNFTIQEIAWSETYQLAAFRSVAPVPETAFPVHSTALSSFNLSAAQLPGGQPRAAGSQQLHVAGRMEFTLLSVVGSLPDSRRTIPTADPRATERFAEMFGGDPITRQKTAAQSLELSRALWDSTHLGAIDSYEMPGKRGDTHLGPISRSLHPKLPEDLDQFQYSDKGLQFRRIVYFWKALVRRHRHESPSDVSRTRAH